MNRNTNSQVSLKLLIDNGRQRILYGESDKKFIDFLFTILALPVGTVIRLLSGQGQDHAHGMVGSLGNLYRSIEDLNTNYFQPNQNKADLLKPKVQVNQSQVGNLLQIGYSSITKNYYRCNNSHKDQQAIYGVPQPNCRDYFTADPTARCPACNSQMYCAAKYLKSADEMKKESSSSDEGGYVKNLE